MSLRESFQALFTPKEINVAEAASKREEALKKEASATEDYLMGKILLDQYKKILESTAPLTKINLRKLASRLK